jgi:hypothetical protein
LWHKFLWMLEKFVVGAYCHFALFHWSTDHRTEFCEVIDPSRTRETIDPSMKTVRRSQGT